MRCLARIIINRVATKRNDAVKPYLRGNVLDIGCGKAYLTKFVPVGSYTGIDANENIVRRLKETKPSYDFHCINIDNQEGVLKLISLGSSFDTITLIAVVEHLHHPQTILGACFQLLKDDGELVITTPTPSGNKISQLALQIAGKRSSLFPHVRLYALQDLEALLLPLGFKLTHYEKFLLGANQLLVYSKRSQGLA